MHLATIPVENEKDQRLVTNDEREASKDPREGSEKRGRRRDGAGIEPAHLPSDFARTLTAPKPVSKFV
jgi:hypothetical protein